MWFERHIVFWVVALAVFIGLIWLLSPILLPFLAGIAIAYVLDPLANRLERMGMSRLVAALLILGLFVLVFVALLLIDRAGAGEPARRRSSIIFRAIPSELQSSAERSEAYLAAPHPRRQARKRRQVDGRSDEPGDGLPHRRTDIGVDQGPGPDLAVLAPRHHAGGGVLSDLRLGPHGGDRR